MHLHILGICGTFMAGIAALARESGHRVTGSDANAWPPMSTQLEQLGITVLRGYEPAHLQPAPDVVVVGNVMTRGNPAVEYVLNESLPYVSGPELLAQHVLRERHVLAVAGTHGKTTTTSLLAWLLDRAGFEPGFLIGGVAPDFGVSARLGKGRYFVIEADGIRCSQLESCMLTPFPLAGAMLEAVQLPGRPKLFVCRTQARVDEWRLPEDRVFGHYAASREWNRVIERAQWVPADLPAPNATSRPRRPCWRIRCGCGSSKS